MDLVDYLTLARERGASDLHITPNAPPTARIFGALQPLSDKPLSALETREIVYGVLKENQRARLEHDWELDFAIQIEGLGRFRANASFALGNVEANFRFIAGKIPSLSELGHSPTVQEWCQAKSGLILVTGTSGSGKSTTLASITQTIARCRLANIVLVEDPIEFVFEQGHSLVHQREIGSDTQSFAQALRSGLRQDADVIIVGEMRDEETIHTALTAADTGHLIIGTLHTTDAASAVSRILDAYPENRHRFVGAQLAASLRGVVCQYLLPRHDQPGLVLATELMAVNTAIGACIRERRLSQLQGLMQIGSADGMHTIDDSLMELLLDNRISLSDALAHCSEPNYFKEQFQNARQKNRKGWFSRVLGS
ncbi:PilT/PilU family type 4a pilus ATPase [Phragmitibacter flavus]|uniref:PilT/PilU family type 4a pilus ATPase n=1 Tax=Phragmitibacter flavus TaxID=2576071 RepID=A0A5R8KB62_9BACT|nr:PilT/PilU family type 4a pilus ATPase [Phragmitibacter flavus]TLD69553.1 PilT/PilU family type 4a pilus ATPase [Phragmitibacter flavus]